MKFVPKKVGTFYVRVKCAGNWAQSWHTKEGSQAF